MHELAQRNHLPATRLARVRVAPSPEILRQFGAVRREHDEIVALALAT